jgi:hypothetical protein
MILTGRVTLTAMIDSPAWAAMPVGTELRTRGGALLATRVHEGTLLEPKTMALAASLMPAQTRGAQYSEVLQ